MQNAAAELMAVAIVEILEEVDVDHENGNAVTNLRKVDNQFVEARSVVDAGKRVDLGALAQLIIPSLTT